MTDAREEDVRTSYIVRRTTKTEQLEREEAERIKAEEAARMEVEKPAAALLSISSCS